MIDDVQLEQNHPERQYSSAQAQLLLDEALLEAGLRCHDLIACSDVSPFSYKCALVQNDGVILATTSGKGRNLEQAKLSACYESLEYACSFIQRRPAGMVFEFLSLEEVRERGIPTLEKFYESNFFEQIDPKKRITWLPFVSLRDQSISYLPWALFNPTFLEFDDNPDQLMSEDMCFLTTGNGIAIGASVEEAVIHGLSEAIERDATSVYLKQTFLLNIPPTAIDVTTLPEQLQKLVRKIESTTRHQLVLIDMPVRIAGFFAFQARLVDTAYLCGYGCSANIEYAIERALLECKEAFDVSYCTEVNPDFSFIENSPALMRCAKNDLSSFVREKLIVYKPFKPSIVPSDFLGFYQHILKLLDNHQHAVYINTFRKFSNGVSIIIAFVPGFSFLFAVQKGYPCDLEI